MAREKQKFYTVTMSLPFDHPLMQAAFAWASATVPSDISTDDHCPTRDVLRARIDSLRITLQRKGYAETQVPLVHAVLAEIGNNAYDHNVGKWRDIPGVFFIRTLEPSPIFVIADRGQGIRTTLKRVRPNLDNDRDALHVAFLEHITGRAPEHRGNGLKFVRKILCSDGLDMLFQSGTAAYCVQEKQEQWMEKTPAVPGCIAVLSFTGS